MRSIGSRLALWYALASTATLLLAVVAGYYLLERHLVAGLDATNRKAFQQLRAVLRADFTVLEPETMAERLRAATESTANLFFVEARLRALGPIFASDNLAGAAIPGAPAGATEFSVALPGVGELRAGQFAIGRIEVSIGSSLAPVRQVLRGYVQASAALIAALAALSCALGLGLSRAALRPVRAIQRTAEHIGSDNLSERIPVGRVDDEISNLARLLNRTFDRLEVAFNQVRRFTAEASHELKTPLALARAHGEKLLADGAVAPAHAEEVQNLLEELGRLEKIIEELLLLSRAEAHAVPLELRVADPQPFIAQFAQDARALGEYQGVRIAETYDGEGRVEFDPKWLRQVLLNLVTNALRVSPRGGSIAITSRLGDDTWRLSVEDEGPGVPPEQLERIFERFFRLAPSGDDDRGSGLGLAISRSIVALHRGTIRAELPEKGRGLRVIVELPVVAAGAARLVVDGATVARAGRIAG
jgi:two-component system heavy metal sensor histidine kinase CusS